MKHTVTEVVLSHGGRGLFINIPDASVMTFDINFRAGEFLVEPDKWEVAHLMEHVLLGANDLIPKARDFQAELERNGAYSNASTSVYDITYEAECADFEWDRVFNLLLVAITRPLFLDEEFKAEYGNVQEELTSRSNNHFRRLSLEMRQQMGLLVKTDTQRLALMSNVTLDDVRRHYQRTHTAPNMRFVIAGKLTPKRKQHLVDVLEKIDLVHTGRRYRLPYERPQRLDRTTYVRNKTIDNLYFYIDTFLRRRLSDTESDALNLTNVMLTETLYSKILGTAREKGLVYGMSSGLSQSRDISNWWFGAQVSDKNAPALMHIINTELEKVMNGEIKQQDIIANKQYALGRFQRSAQTVSGTAAGYTNRYFFDDVVEDYYNIPARIAAINKQGIVAVVQDMFRDNVWGFGVLGGCGQQFSNDLREQISVLWDNPRPRHD